MPAHIYILCGISCHAPYFFSLNTCYAVDRHFVHPSRLRTGYGGRSVRRYLRLVFIASLMLELPAYFNALRKVTCL